MRRIKIKCTNRNKEAWQQLLTVLSNNDVRCSKLVPCSDGYIAHCNSDEDCDRIFHNKCMRELNYKNFDIMVPPEVKAKRTIIVKMFDEYIADFSQEEIIHEISECNPQLRVVELYKLRSGNVLKIVFGNHTMAQACLREGLRMFHLHVPTSSLTGVEYSRVDYCYRCYAINDHYSKDCPKGVDYVICSSCSSRDHSFRQCNSSDHKCVNCGGPHITLSAKCPTRRNVVQTEGEKKKKNSRSFTAAVKETGSGVSHESSKNVTAYMCMLHASLVSNGNATLYEATLNQLLSVNDLPSFSLGNVRIVPSFGAQVCDGVGVNSRQDNSRPCDLVTGEDDAGAPSGEDLVDPDPVVAREMKTVASVQQFSGDGDADGAKCSIIIEKGKKFGVELLSAYVKNNSLLVEHVCINKTQCTKDIHVRINSGNVGCLCFKEANASQFLRRGNTVTTTARLTRLSTKAVTGK